MAKWVVDLDDHFVPEYKTLQDELLAPRADTVNGSRHANMKELRFDAADGVWRFAFAFDPKRQGIVLCGGDKSGVSEKRFNQQLIDKADARFHAHLSRIKKEKGKEKR